MRRVGGLTVLLLLLTPLALQCAQLLHGRALVWGGELWPQYAALRSECLNEAPPTVPGVGAAGRQAAQAAGTSASPPITAAKKASNEASLDAALDDLDDDLLGDDPAPEPTSADEVGAKDPGTPPAAGDDLDAALDELGDDPAPPPPSKAATPAAAKVNDPPAAMAASALPAAPPLPRPKATATQLAYCRLERQVAGAAEAGMGFMPTLMVLLLLISAFIATARREHVSLRMARTPLEDRVSNAAQLIGNLLVAASSWHMREHIVSPENGPELLRQGLWVGGMLGLAALNLVWIVALPVRAQDNVKTGFGRAIACIPLYSWMAIVSGLYFLTAEDHPAGIAIYLNKITEFSILYIQVGLYLWTGMLLRDTRLGQLMFDILRPLKLPPDLFAVLVVVLAAVPTAYSGASGILVLALGATIYTELRRSGASQQRALAATAMSGSLGVVLPPCLLVVIVASINLDVTTDELFHWGWRVFALTTTIFLAISFIWRRSPWTVKPLPGAVGQSLAAIRKLMPYGAIALGVVAFFWFVLNAGLDEHTAPYVLPVAMLALLPWDRIAARRAADSVGLHRETSLDTGTHIGALLMLMGLSACLGGVIERAEIVELFPHAMGSPLAAMALLMVVLVLIGMVMDPYGAVILVSVTLYPIAKANGIHPLNFWMTALVSFELGYLTPPVALNHLLTRQVVQHLPEYDEDEEPAPGASFITRHERLIVPITVLTITLLVVALGPIIYGIRG